jgi:hypothetical protein
VQAALRRIVHRLIAGDFEGLCADGSAYRQHPEWLRRSLQQYERTLVDLPDEAFTHTQLGPITERRYQWWLVQPLWTAEEGRSDVDIVGGVVGGEDGIWHVYLEDLRVQ